MIDFHCHLDLFPNPQSLISECEGAGVHVLSVTTTPSAWHGTLALAPTSKHIRTALGLHPELAHERHGELALFDRFLPETRYVGEIGLDHSAGTEANWPVQSRVLTHILRSCQEAGGRILSLHSRGSANEVLDHLERFPRAGTAVLHWLSCGVTDLERAIALGCWFSVGPTMLMSKKGNDLVSHMPKDRVLTESDGPFAMFQGRQATPLDTAHAIPLLTRIWGQSGEQVRVQLFENLRRLGFVGDSSLTDI
jgi:TatD DNase family protein